LLDNVCVQDVRDQFAAFVLDRLITLRVRSIEEVNHTLATPNRERVCRERQILRFLQRMTLHKSEPAVPNRSDITVIWVSRWLEADMDNHWVLRQFVQMWDALHQNGAVRRYARDLAVTQRLVH